MGSTNVKLVRSGTPCEGDKRQGIPYIIEWTCLCGCAHSNDYTEGHYLSYPSFPGEQEVGLYCDECGYEEKLTLSVDITARIVDG